MLIRIGVLAASVLVLLGGCASNVSLVKQRAALDLGCEAADIAVEFRERPYLGVTRYAAAGCGVSRQYECRSRSYSIGLPLGMRVCKHEGSPGPTVIDVSVGTVSH